MRNRAEQFRAAQAGDRAARDVLAEANLGLVHREAGRLRSNGKLDFDDLVGAGQYGLLEAIDHFDPAKGEFSTYAAHWIRWRMSEAIDASVGPYRQPTDWLRQRRRVSQVEEQLQASLGRPPTPAELAAATGLSEERLATVGPAPEQVRAESGALLEELLADPAADPALALPAEDPLPAALAALSNQDRALLTWRYGLDGQPELTLDAIGQHLGRSRETARKRLQQAELALRQALALQRALGPSDTVPLLPTAESAETCRNRSFVDRRDFVWIALRGVRKPPAVAADFGLSARQGYEWLRRWREHGEAGLHDRSSRPHKPATVPDHLAEAVLRLRGEHPAWGPARLRAHLVERQPDIAWPSSRWIAGLLRQHGLARPWRRLEEPTPSVT